MNNTNAVLTLLMRRQRKRKIRNILLTLAAAGIVGWMLTYSQQQAFSLTPPTPVATPETIHKPQLDGMKQDNE